jgi:hypothetical protein
MEKESAEVEGIGLGYYSFPYITQILDGIKDIAFWKKYLLLDPSQTSVPPSAL